RVDAQFAQLLSTRLLGASVAFFRGTEVFASAMASAEAIPPGTRAPRQEDMAAPLAEVHPSEGFGSRERTDPIALPTGGLAVYSLVIGSAGYAEVGYAVARPVVGPTAPVEIFSLPSAQDWSEFLSSS